MLEGTLMIVSFQLSHHGQDCQPSDQAVQDPPPTWPWMPPRKSSTGACMDPPPHPHVHPVFYQAQGRRCSGAFRMGWRGSEWGVHWEQEEKQTFKLEAPLQVKLGCMDGEGYRIAWAGRVCQKLQQLGSPSGEVYGQIGLLKAFAAIESGNSALKTSFFPTGERNSFSSFSLFHLTSPPSSHAAPNHPSIILAY